jgi:protein-disulfide isomerase
MTRTQFLAVIAGAAALAAALVAASQLGARDSTEAAQARAGLFAGIPQDGLALGRDDAPVTLVEYADLQCPYCAQWSLGTLPVLVARYVRTGRLRIVFRGLAFIGPDSETALRTAIAAGRDGNLWDVVHGIYGRQGAENAGWVTADVLDEVAWEAGLDSADLAERRHETWVDAQLAASRALAEASGVRGTPSFQLGRTGGPLERLELDSLAPEAIAPAIDALLAP